jgi:hypothetical protein
MDQPTRDCEVRKVAYHEAAHAVLLWNLGLGVQWILVDRVRCCGKVQPLNHPKDRVSRIGKAVGSVAGLAAHSFLEPSMEWEDVWRCQEDLQRALAFFLPPCELTDGEQLGVALALTRRVVALLDTSEVRKQIENLVRPLLRDGRLYQSQIHSRLQKLPASAVARRKCREFVTALECERHELIRSAQGYAPEFRWPELA